MNIYRFPKREEWQELLKRPSFETASLDSLVQEVLDDVKENGDTAVLKYTHQFDKVQLVSLQVSEEEIQLAEMLVDDALKSAMQLAIDNIKKFHSAQKHEIQGMETMPGMVCKQKSVAIEKVGLYVPGGTAPLFSTVLMLAVPAKVAGCKEIVLCTPPAKDGSVHPAILYAAKLVGVTAIFKCGGI